MGMAIVLQETLRAPFYAPFYAALALGAYRQEGIEVRLVTAPTPAAAARGLADGSADVAWGGPMRVLHTYDNHPDCDLVCFCEVVTRDPFFLLGRQAKADFRLPDLTGLRLATVSEVPTPWMCLQEDLRQAGLDPARLARVSDRSMSENSQALRRGEVDVVQLFQPFVETLVEDGAGHIWSAAADRGPTSYTTLYAPRGLLATRRQECEGMVRAIYRTLKWVHAGDGTRLAAAIADYFPDLPQARLAKALDRYLSLGIWGRDPRLPRSGFERLRAGLLSGGLISTGAAYERLVDNSLAEGVLQQDPPPLTS
jgi:NitT/TauT family transport system substrate-binding protein